MLKYVEHFSHLNNLLKTHRVGRHDMRGNKLPHGCGGLPFKKRNFLQFNVNVIQAYRRQMERIVSRQHQNTTVKKAGAFGVASYHH